MKHSGLFILFALLATSCIKYEQGPSSGHVAQNDIPTINFQSRVFYIDPPFTAKIGETDDADSVKARTTRSGDLSCVSYTDFAWVPNFTTDRQTPLKGFPGDFEPNPDQEKNPKVKRRGRNVRNEFSIDARDLTLHENNPNWIEIIESFNIFSEEKKQGLAPDMLLMYAQALNDKDNVKVISVTSVAKTAGAFYGKTVAGLKNDACSKKNLVHGLDYGAALSVAILLEFQNADDRSSFQNQFGTDAPFAKTKSDQATDAKMSAFLVEKKATLELNIAEIGGDLEKTKSKVSSFSCALDKLDDCRESRLKLFKFFFSSELQPPTSPDQTNGWIAVKIENTALSPKK